MKHFKTLMLVCSLFLGGMFTSYAQTAITFSSNNENIKFTVFIDGQQLTDFYETWIRIANIPEGYHDFTFLFEADSVADYSKNIQCNNGFEKIFSVEEKPGLKKGLNKTGRQLGKKMDVGEHNEEFNYLVDVYHVKQVEKISYSGNGSTELEVTTDKTLGTSILPISKKKTAK